MSYRDLRDYGYTNDEIYGSPDDNEDGGAIGGLCMMCDHAEGPYNNDRCMHYKMPLYMVYRQKKCKHFKEINWSYEINL